MKKSLLTLTLCSAILLLSACHEEKVELQKSPCAGLAGSPCGPKRPVNGTLNQGASQSTPMAVA